MKNRSARLVWIVPGILFLSSSRAQQGDSYSLGATDAVLDEVERERRAIDPDPERLLAAAERFSLHVRTAGNDMVQEALESVGSPDPDRSRRAQLVLAQLPSLPEQAMEGLRRSTASNARIYEMIRAPIEPAHEARTPHPPQSVHVSSLLQQVSAELGARLAITDDELASAKPEFVADYRRDFLPRLSRIWQFIDESDCFPADLDGDGAHELVVVCDRLWETYWIHDLAFVAVISAADSGQRGVQQFWRLPRGGSVSRTQVIDLDLDGRAEVALWIDVTGGRAPFSLFVALSRRGTTSVESDGMSYRTRILSVAEHFVVATRSGLDWSLAGGAATIRCGSLAREVRVQRFEHGSFKHVMTVWLPLVDSGE